MEDKNGHIKTNVKEILKIWEDHYARENKTKREGNESNDHKQEQGNQIGSEDEGKSVIEEQMAVQKIKLGNAAGADKIWWEESDRMAL